MADPAPSAVTGKDGKLAAWDPKAGEVVRVTPEELHKAFLSGSHGLISDQSYPMLDPDGTTHLVPSKDVGEALRQGGYTFGNQLDVIRQEQSGAAGAFRAFADGVANRAAMGFGDALQVQAGVDPDEIQVRKEVHGTARTVGEVAGAGAGALALGALAPAGLAASVLPEASAASGVLPTVLTSAAGTAVEGAVHGVGDAVSEAALGKTSVTAESLIAHGGLGFALGGVLGGVLKVPGARALRAADRELVLEGAQGAKPASLGEAWAQVQDAYRNGPAVRAAKAEVDAARGALDEANAIPSPLKNPLKPGEISKPLPDAAKPGPNTLLGKLDAADAEVKIPQAVRNVLEDDGQTVSVERLWDAMKRPNSAHARALRDFLGQRGGEDAVAAFDAARGKVGAPFSQVRRLLQSAMPGEAPEGAGAATSQAAVETPSPIAGVTRWYHGSPYRVPKSMGDFHGDVMFLSDSPHVAGQYKKALLASGRRPVGALDGPGVHEVVPQFGEDAVFDTRRPEHLQLFKELAKESRTADPDGGFRPGDMFHVPPSVGGKGVIAGNFPSFGVARELLPMLEKRGFSAAIVGEGGEQGASLAVFAPQKNLRFVGEASDAAEGSTRNLRRVRSVAPGSAEPGPFAEGGFNNEAFPGPSLAAEGGRVASAQAGLGSAMADVPRPGSGGLASRGLAYMAGRKLLGGELGGFIAEQAVGSNPVRVAALARAGRVVRDYISDRMGAFADGAARSSEAMSLPRAIAPATMAMLNARDGSERRDALAARMEELATYGDDASVGDRATAGTHHIEADAPDAATAIRAKTVQVANFLKQAAPKPLAVRNPLNPRPSYDLVSDRDAHRFAELDATLQDPLRIVDQMAAGRVPAPEVFAAVRTTYPELYGQIVQSFRDHIAKNPESVSWATTVRAGIAFGISAHPSLDPANLKRQQEAIQAPAQAPAGAPRGPRGAKAPPARAASYGAPSAATAAQAP